MPIEPCSLRNEYLSQHAPADDSETNPDNGEPMLKPRYFELATIAVLAMMMVGCSSGNKPIAAVTGTVMHESKPVVGCSVSFMPIGSEENREPGKMGYGETDGDGRFRLTTYRPNDGAVVCRHRVEICYPDPFVDLPGKFVGPLEVEVESKDNVFDFVLE